MNYTFHQLQVFLMVCKTESITKASAELNLTQPAVSIQLKNFQDQFDIPLTEVIGRKLFVTDFGKKIAQAAEIILNEAHAINYQASAYKGFLTGRLKLSVVSTAKYIIPYFLSDFLKRYPQVELILDVTNRAKVLESLEKNEVDFSLVSILPQRLAIETLELMPNKLYLVGNTEKQYSEKVYEKTLLEKIPLIYRESGSGTRNVMENFIRQNELKVDKKIELMSNEAVKQAVLAGLGCSIMPMIGIKNELKNGELQIIPVKGLPLSSIWNLVWVKNKRFSPIAAAFLDYLQKEKEQLIRTKFDWVNN